MAASDPNPSGVLLAPGTLIGGKYRLERLLGQGGMGSVWLGENVDIARRVAIKFLLPQLASDQEMLSRFRMEARAAAAIGHPGIVDVLDMGRTDDGGAFIVMESLDGETLGARLSATGPLPLDTALWVLVQVSDALAAAHDRGVIHRDLKPDNLFLVQRPVPMVKILDFGISKFQRGDDLALTRTGIVMGTPLYMSPEQARGSRDVGIGTDLYSFGAIAYHVFAGVPPFVGSSYNEVIAKVLTEQHAPLWQIRSDVPEALSRLIDALLEKDWMKRPPTAHAVKEALLQLHPLVVPTPAQIEATSVRREPSVAPLAMTGEGLEATAASQHRSSGESDTAPPSRPPPHLAEAAVDATAVSQRKLSSEHRRPGTEPVRSVHVDGLAGEVASPGTVDQAPERESSSTAAPLASSPSTSPAATGDVGGGRGKRLLLGVAVAVALIGGAVALVSRTPAPPPAPPADRTPPPAPPVRAAETPEVEPPEAPPAVTTPHEEAMTPVSQAAEPQPATVAAPAAQKRPVREAAKPTRVVREEPPATAEPPKQPAKKDQLDEIDRSTDFFR